MNIILKNGSGEIEEKKSSVSSATFIKIKSCNEEAEQYITAVKEEILGCKT